MIEEFAAFIPESLKSKSGSVFYSGRNAFNSQSDVYILGLNPGGSADEQANETIAWHTEQVLYHKPADWSEYQDERWMGKAPGTHGLQPRVLHLFRQLNYNPQWVPASNLVFLRTAREHDLKGKFEELATASWPFHQNVISRLCIKTVLCFGKKSGQWVCNKLGATTKIGEFVENNKRQWKSSAYANKQQISVIVATHPSIADWCNQATDPTPLIQQVILGSKII